MQQLEVDTDVATARAEIDAEVEGRTLPGVFAETVERLGDAEALRWRAGDAGPLGAVLTNVTRQELLPFERPRLSAVKSNARSTSTGRGSSPVRASNADHCCRIERFKSSGGSTAVASASTCARISFGSALPAAAAITWVASGRSATIVFTPCAIAASVWTTIPRRCCRVLRVVTSTTSG